MSNETQFLNVAQLSRSLFQLRQKAGRSAFRKAMQEAARITSKAAKGRVHQVSGNLRRAIKVRGYFLVPDTEWVSNIFVDADIKRAQKRELGRALRKAKKEGRLPTAKDVEGLAPRDAAYWGLWEEYGHVIKFSRKGKVIGKTEGHSFLGTAWASTASSVRSKVERGIAEEVVKMLDKIAKQKRAKARLVL